MTATRQIPATTPPLQRIEVPLQWDATAEVPLDSKGDLIVRASLVNGGSQRIFVFDRPIAPGGRGSKVEPDPDAPYRFVRDERLRLLLGDAPLPRYASVTTHNYPLATPVEPGARWTRMIRVPLPALEHSAYWSIGSLRKRPPGSTLPPVEEAPVRSVELLLDYAVEQPNMVVLPGALDGTVDFQSMSAVYASVVRVHQSIPIQGVVALRRPQIDARVRLPGELEERFAPGEGG